LKSIDKQFNIYYYSHNGKKKKEKLQAIKELDQGGTED